MKRSRLNCVEQTIIDCLKVDITKPDLQAIFWNYHETKMFEVQINKSRITVGYQKRPMSGGEVNLFIVNKPASIIKKDIEGSRRLAPNLIFTLGRESDGTISLEMGPSRGANVDMLAFHWKFADVLLSIQKSLGTLVYQENLYRKSKKRKK